MTIEINQEWLAPCGLYCGVCGIRLAHKDHNQKLKEILARTYGLTPGDIRCEGCLSAAVFKFCEVCKIRACAQEKGYEGCYQCADFPCALVQAYPWPEAKARILAAVPRWRELGTAAWVAAEDQRHHCPHCGHQLFRGVTKCRNCKEPVDLAG